MRFVELCLIYDTAVLSELVCRKKWLLAKAHV